MVSRRDRNRARNGGRVTAVADEATTGWSSKEREKNRSGHNGHTTGSDEGAQVGSTKGEGGQTPLTVSSVRTKHDDAGHGTR